MAAADTLERPADTDTEAEGKDRLARALDIAGVCAAVILGAILFDVFSGGKITRLITARRGQAPGPSGPCEGCGGSSSSNTRPGGLAADDDD